MHNKSIAFDFMKMDQTGSEDAEDYADGRQVHCEACCKNKDVCNNGGLCGTTRKSAYI